MPAIRGRSSAARRVRKIGQARRRSRASRARRARRFSVAGAAGTSASRGGGGGTSATISGGAGNLALACEVPDLGRASGGGRARGLALAELLLGALEAADAGGLVASGEGHGLLGVEAQSDLGGGAFEAVQLLQCPIPRGSQAGQLVVREGLPVPLDGTRPGSELLRRAEQVERQLLLALVPAPLGLQHGPQALPARDRPGAPLLGPPELRHDERGGAVAGGPRAPRPPRGGPRPSRRPRAGRPGAEGRLLVATAGDADRADGHLLDQPGVMLVARPQRGRPRRDAGGDRLPFLVGEDEGLGGQAMLQGIPSRGVLARGRPRPRRLDRVLLVGEDLRGGGHRGATPQGVSVGENPLHPRDRANLQDIHGIFPILQIFSGSSQLSELFGTNLHFPPTVPINGGWGGKVNVGNRGG